MPTLRFSVPLPPPLARCYIEAIARCMTRGHPFFHEACEAHHALLDPCNEINEFLGWIDKHPASQFEQYLRCLVHGAPRS